MNLFICVISVKIQIISYVEFVMMNYIQMLKILMKKIHFSKIS